LTVELYIVQQIGIAKVFMKTINFFVSAVICLAVLALASNASAQTVKQGVVTVVRIQGEVRYSSGDNVWHPLTPGTTLGANDVIQTGANSTADLILSEKTSRIGFRSNAGNPVGGVLEVAGLPKYNTGSYSTPEQNVIRLQADTVLAIDKFIFTQTGADKVSDTELDLRAGKIFGNVKKISAASKYLVKMPSGVAGIRGTTFLLGANGEVTVLSGSVVISTIGVTGQIVTTVLAAGDQYNPRTGLVTRLTPNSYFAALFTAKEIVIAINELVTVVETPTAHGPDKTTLVVSPTSGNSQTIIIVRR